MVESDSGTHTVEDALDNIAPNSFHRRLLLLTGAILSFSALEVLNISFVVPILITEWELSGVAAGALGSAGLVGSMIGNWIGGYYGDRMGRLPALQLAIVGFSVFTALTALATGLYSALLFRLCTGIGVGAAITLDVSYFSEFLPGHARGRYIVLLESFWPLGMVLATVISWSALQYHRPWFAAIGDPWRWVFLLSAVPIFVLVLVRRELSETPYYLASNDDLAGAAVLLERIAKPDAVIPELTSSKSASDASPGLTALFETDLLGRTVMISTAWFGINFGYYGIFIWLPSTLQALDLPGGTYVQLLIVALLQLPGILGAVILIDRFGRKYIIGGFLLASGVSALLFAGGISNPGDTLYLLTPLQSLFLASFFLIGAWGPMFVYTTELYPTAVRGTGFGFATGIGKIASIIGPVLAGLLIEINYAVAMTPFGFGLLLAGLVVLGFGEETKGRSFS